MAVPIASKLNHQSQVLFTQQVTRLALMNSSTPIVSTKFSPHSAAFLHLIYSIQPDIPVVWVDTGYNTRGTIKFADHLTNLLKLNLHVYTPVAHELTVPPDLDDPTHAAFSYDVKIEPFERAITEMSADMWLSSIRSYQSSYRQSLEIFKEKDSDLLKVSPMLHWTDQDVMRYLHDHGLPTGPACYDPTKGEPLRECGLHL